MKNILDFLFGCSVEDKRIGRSANDNKIDTKINKSTLLDHLNLIKIDQLQQNKSNNHINGK